MTLQWRHQLCQVISSSSGDVPNILINTSYYLSAHYNKLLLTPFLHRLSNFHPPYLQLHPLSEEEKEELIVETFVQYFWLIYRLSINNFWSARFFKGTVFPLKWCSTKNQFSRYCSRWDKVNIEKNWFLVKHHLRLVKYYSAFRKVCTNSIASPNNITGPNSKTGAVSA